MKYERWIGGNLESGWNRVAIGRGLNSGKDWVGSSIDWLKLNWSICSDSSIMSLTFLGISTPNFIPTAFYSTRLIGYFILFYFRVFLLTNNNQVVEYNFPQRNLKYAFRMQWAMLAKIKDRPTRFCFEKNEYRSRNLKCFWSSYSEN